MPTVAGGIFAGQLHAWYELMGPSTAYFIGGGVALHKNGPLKGANLCARILNEAAELRRSSRKAKTVDNIQTTLIEEAEEAYADSVYSYISPADMAEQAQTQLSWFSR